MSFNIRKAGERDVERIAFLSVDTTALMSSLCPEGFGEGLRSKLDLQAEKKIFTEALADDETGLFVAKTAEEVIGFVMAVVERYSDDHITAPFVTVQFLAVDNSFRRKGTGKALMKAAEDWARSKGVSTMDLIVWASNEPAKALFKGQGFIPLETRMARKIE